VAKDDNLPTVSVAQLVAAMREFGAKAATAEPIQTKAQLSKRQLADYVKVIGSIALLMATNWFNLPYWFIYIAYGLGAWGMYGFLRYSLSPSSGAKPGRGGARHLRLSTLIPGDRTRSYLPYTAWMLPNVPSRQFHYGYTYLYLEPTGTVPDRLIHNSYSRYNDVFNELFVTVKPSGKAFPNQVLTNRNLPSPELASALGQKGLAAVEALRDHQILTFENGSITVAGYGGISDPWRLPLSTQETWDMFAGVVSGPLADLVEALAAD